jgi:hypothetical protein
MNVSTSMDSKLKQALLILASLTVMTIALCYGVSPRWFAQTFLGVSELDINFAHILRAVMCLYLGLAMFWLVGAFNKQYRNVALVILMIFSGGLLLGRVLSFLVDGQPSTLLQFYAGIELAVLPFAYWLLRRREAE